MSEVSLKKRLEKAQKKIKNKGVYICVLQPEDYHIKDDAIIDYLTKKLNKKGIYVTLNKPYNDLSANLKSRNINTSRLYFIDGTSKSNAGGKTVADKEKCAYISSPESLTELSLIITNESNKGEFQFLFFDSITTLLLYNSVTATEKFMFYIIPKARNLGMEMILISINEENSNKLLPMLSQICDDCIYI